MVKIFIGHAIVVFQHASESFSAAHTPVAASHGLTSLRKQDYVALALVISPGVEVLDVLANRSTQRRLAKQDQLR